MGLGKYMKIFKQNWNHAVIKLAILIFPLEFYHVYFADIGLEKFFIEHFNGNQLREYCKAPTNWAGTVSPYNHRLRRG